MTQLGEGEELHWGKPACVSCPELIDGEWAGKSTSVAILRRMRLTDLFWVRSLVGPGSSNPPLNGLRCHFIFGLKYEATICYDGTSINDTANNSSYQR